MKKLDMIALFKPYTGNGATLEKTINWLKKESNAPEPVINRVLNETFLKLAEGYQFSTTGCNCGCGLKNAHTAIEHYMLKEVIKLRKKADKAYLETIEKGLEARIEAHAKFLQEKPKNGLSISRVLRKLRRADNK